jgi:uncharacterized protein
LIHSGATLHIPNEVARHLGYYVYVYVDPRSQRIFYVGKGKGDRILAHLFEQGDSRKHQIIAELSDAGLEPRLEVLAHGLRDEETALRVEAAVIDALKLDELTNLCRGWRSVEMGRLSLSELIAYYAAKPVEVEHAALLIRINRLYRHNMSPVELYEATRGVWRLGARRNNAAYALAVFEGVVREVYAILAWQPAGSTPYLSRVHAEMPTEGRWEFTGEPAGEAIRAQYVGRSVASYFRKGQQSPVVYANC